MHWIVYLRRNGCWDRFGTERCWTNLAWQLEYMKTHRIPFLVTRGDTGEVVEEWFPDDYDRDPFTNNRERQVGCDCHKRRFPGVRRRATR